VLEAQFRVGNSAPLEASVEDLLDLLSLGFGLVDLWKSIVAVEDLRDQSLVEV